MFLNISSLLFLQFINIIYAGQAAGTNKSEMILRTIDGQSDRHGSDNLNTVEYYINDDYHWQSKSWRTESD